VAKSLAASDPVEPRTPADARNPYSDFVSLAVLTALGLAFAAVPLARGRMFYYWDNARLYFPQTVFLHDGLRAGHLPQWNFAVSGGYPVIGEGQAAHFHPIRVLFAWIFPPHAAFMLEIGLYIALTGVVTFLFLRELKVTSRAALLGGLTNMFCSFSVVSVKNIAHPRSIWILPLVMLLAERYVARPRKTLWILLAGLAFGLQLLSGNPHFAAITAVSSALYICFRAWQRSWRENEGLRSAVWRVLSTVGPWVLAGMIGFAIAAIQMLPQLLHTKESTRQGGMALEFAAGLSANLRYMGQLLLPYAYEQGHVIADPAAFGGMDFNEVSYRGIYIGMVPIVLAAVGVWRRKGAAWGGWPLVALTIVGLGLALGTQTPLYPALWSLPVFGNLRYAYRFLGVPAFSLACLAGFGLDELARDRNVSWRSLAVPLTGVLALGLLGAAYLWIAPPGWMLIARDFERGAIQSLVLLASACVLVFASAAGSGRWREALLSALLVFTFADLWWFRARSSYTATTPVREVFAQPPLAQVLHRDPEIFRVMSLERWETASVRPENLRDFMQSHASSLWGIDSADPYESLMLRRYFIVREAMVFELLNSPAAASKLRSYLGALNIKYLVTPKTAHPADWIPVTASARAVTWRNPLAQPRAFLVGSVLPERIEERAEWEDYARRRQGRYPDMVRDWQTRVAESEIVDNILADSVDYARTAIVAGDDLPRLEPLGQSAAVLSSSYANDVMRFTVNTDRPAFLVVGNNYYPGWTATVNGAPTAVRRADWVLSGVFVPAGRSEIVLRFRTPGLQAGMAVTGLALLLVLLTLAWLGSRSSRVHEARRTMRFYNQLTSRADRPAFILVAALWFALLASWAEVAALAAAWFIGHVYVYNIGLHLLWMTPLGNAVWFLGVGAILALLSLLWSRLASVRAQATVLGFVFALVFACFFDGKLYWKALLLLAAGAGVQIGRMAAAKSDRFRNLVRRTLPAMIAITILVGAGGTGFRRIREWRRETHTAPAAPGAPNVLLVVMDAARAMNMSFYGYSRGTAPNLAAFARQGVLFEWAFAPSSWSLPSHSSFLTGRYPFELNVAVRVPLNDTYPTLAEVLHRRGYLTAGFVANMGYTARASGLSRGFVHYEDFPPTASQVAGATVLARTALYRTGIRNWFGYYQIPGRKLAGRLSNDFLKWQAKHSERPFFTFMNFFDTHAPYVVPKPFDGRFGTTKGAPLLSEQRSIEVNSPQMRAQIQAQIDAYDNLVAYLDHELGRMFAELERRGVLNNTIVIVTADHGEEFGEHGHLGHGAGLNSSELHVPLMIVAKDGRAPAGVRVTRPASLRDLPATVLELTGTPARLPGTSLSRYWKDPWRVSDEDLVLSSQGWEVSLADDKYHYTRDEQGRERLYAYRTDIFEQHNLIATPEAAEVLPRFRAAVQKRFRPVS
jgi:arylsulfatase A-like enzyme